MKANFIRFTETQQTGNSVYLLRNGSDVGWALGGLCTELTTRTNSDYTRTIILGDTVMIRVVYMYNVFHQKPLLMGILTYL